MQLLVGCLTSQQHASVSQGRASMQLLVGCLTSQQHASVSQGRASMQLLVGCLTSQQQTSVSQGRTCMQNPLDAPHGVDNEKDNEDETMMNPLFMTMTILTIFTESTGFPAISVHVGPAGRALSAGCPGGAVVVLVLALCKHGFLCTSIELGQNVGR